MWSNGKPGLGIDINEELAKKFPFKERVWGGAWDTVRRACLLYTSPSPRDATLSRMPSSA